MVACDATRNAVLPQPETGHSQDGSAVAALPRSGYGFLAGIIGAFQDHGVPLAEKLDSLHLHGGRPGHGGMPKLCAVVLQSVLNIRYAGITPVVAVPKPRQNKAGKRRFKGNFTADGRPICFGDEPMDYVGTDPEKGHQFRCPGLVCAQEGKAARLCYCEYEAWVKPEGRLLRIVGVLPRCTDNFKRIIRKDAPPPETACNKASCTCCNAWAQAA